MSFITATKNIKHSDFYASLVPKRDDKCHFDAMLVRKSNAESVLEIVTFSWCIH